MSFFGGVSDWLGGGAVQSALASFLNAILSALEYLWEAVVWVVNQLVSALVYMFGKIGGALHWLWEHAIKGPLTKLANLIIKAHLWLEEKLAPVIRILKKIRAWYDRIFKTYIRPILNTIQKLRQFLLILRMLHIKFAEQLDRELARIQGDIAKALLLVRGTLNQLIDFANAASDPSRMVRLVAASVAGRRAAAGLCRMWTGLPIGHFLPSHQPDAFPWERPVTRAADLMDPAHNPPASTILSGGLLAPVSAFMEGTNIGDNPSLDDGEVSPYFRDVYNALLASEQAQRWAGDVTRKPVEAVTLGINAIADAGRGGAALGAHLMGV